MTLIRTTNGWWHKSRHFLPHYFNSNNAQSAHSTRLVSQFLENCCLAHPTTAIQRKRGINTKRRDGRLQNATQALTHRISNGFYSTHEQCSRPSPDTLWLSGRRKPPLGRVYARKPSSLLRIGWLKSPHQYCVVARGPRHSNRYIDWHNDTTRAQNWPQVATRPQVNSQCKQPLCSRIQLRPIQLQFDSVRREIHSHANRKRTIPSIRT